MSSHYRIAVVPGDGIGAEVMPVATDLLATCGDRYAFSVETSWLDWSCERFLATGEFLPPDGLDLLAEHDAILLGAVGAPGVADHLSLWGLLIPIRRRFDLYVNLRPIRTYAGLPGKLAGNPPIDILLVRENTEGEYSKVGGRIFEGTPQELAVQEAVFTRRGVERIASYAFSVAAVRKRRVVAATKSNGIIHTMPFWDEVVAEVAAGTDIPFELQHVDALAARFVTQPGDLDVVLGSNLFADILSDLGSALAGSLGLAASGNLTPDTAVPSMFEPVHGSAPDIAGRGVANPIGQVVSAAMMLDHLGEWDAAAAMHGAVETLLEDDGPRTPDIGGTASTGEVGMALQDALGSSSADTDLRSSPGLGQ